MTQRQTSIQLGDATKRQLEKLKALGFGNQTDVIRVAIDRMYREEVRMSNKLTQEQQEQAAQIAQFVIENGRVAATNGKPQRASLAVEVSFEASERGVDSATAEAMGEYIARG